MSVTVSRGIDLVLEHLVYSTVTMVSGCVYSDLTEGPVDDRLNTAEKCLQLLGR